MQCKRTPLSAAWLLTIFLLLLLPVGALAAKGGDLWITFPGTPPSTTENTPDSEGINKPLGAVSWWYSSKEKAYFLFLPAFADASNLTIWFGGAKELTIDGKLVKNGESTSVLIPGARLSVTLDNKSCELRVMQSARIPAMFLHTESGSMEHIHKSKNNEEPGSFLLMDAQGGRLQGGDLSQIKGRGNYTFTLNKKPYQIKLKTSADLCDMGKAKTWILLANHYDNSLLRNKIAFDLADAVGLMYSSKSQAVDIYINSEYRGSYLLCEKVEIGDTRVGINDLEKDTEIANSASLDTYARFGKPYQQGGSKGINIPSDPEDITGGYLLELDYKSRYRPEVSGFVTKRGQSVIIKEPECASQNQAEYIRAFMQGFENAICAKDGRDPATGKHYSEFVDMDSLVKKYLMEEFAKNFDGNRSSQFYYKPADEQSRLAFAGPVWDYDIAFGNYATERNQKVKDPRNFVTNADTGERYYWLPKVYRQADFQAAAIKAYRETYVPALDILLGNRPAGNGRLRSLNDYAGELEASAAMNFTRWPIFNSPNWQVETGIDYPANIAYLKGFIEGRMAFLAESWP